MSWFSTRLPASGYGEHDDEHTSHGKGVKEDLSELTKTFTRQLWGVASFLAPPPTTKSLEQVDPSPPSSSDHHVQANNPHPDSLLQPGEISLSNELVDVDFQASIDPAQDLQEEHRHNLGGPQTYPGEDTSSSSHFTSDHGLTGIGKDLAEFKGSVATGFSKLLKAVREEIDRNEDMEHNAHDPDEDADDDQDYDDNGDDEMKGFVHAGRLPVLDSLFKPLLSGILHNDGDNSSQKSSRDDDLRDEDDEEYNDDPMDERGHQKSRSSGAFDLHRTFGESLGSISKLATSLFPGDLDSDDEQGTAERNPIYEAVGVTEEVLAFARNVSMHPETWLDFPLFTDDDDADDFEMSDAQKEHVHDVERASPELAALRIELCPGYMTKGRFWKIYFVLLHSRLSKKDALLLSTPQIMEARALLLSNLQNKEVQASSPEDDLQPEQEKDASGLPQSFKIVSLQSAMEVPAKDFDQVENLGASQGTPNTSGDVVDDAAEEVQNKNVLASTVKLATPNYEDEEADADKWLHEETSPTPHSGSTSVGLDNEDDVSFSDLEEDDDSMSERVAKSSSLKGTQGWVQLNKDQERQEFKPSKINLDGQTNERRESNDWLKLEEDLDFA